MYPKKERRFAVMSRAPATAPCVIVAPRVGEVVREGLLSPFC